METDDVAKLQKEIRSLKKQVERLEASRATFELMVDRNDNLLSRQLEQTQRQAEELNRINLLADSALDLTKAGYWHVPLDSSGWYNSSERAVEDIGRPAEPRSPLPVGRLGRECPSRRRSGRQGHGGELCRRHRRHDPDV